MAEIRIQSFDPALVRHPPGKEIDPMTRPELGESIQQHGVKVPGQVCDDPAEKGFKRCLMGNHRLGWCRRLGIPFPAQDIGPYPGNAEAIRLRVIENCIRDKMTAPDLLADLEDFVRETGIKSQLEAARQLHLSKSQTSRILSIRRIPGRLLDQAGQVCPSIAWQVAALPTVELMEQGLKRAIAEGLTRDQFKLWADQQKRARSGGKKQRNKLRGIFEGRRFELELFEKDLTPDVVAWIKGLLAKIGRNEQMPPPGLAYLFGS